MALQVVECEGYRAFSAYTRLSLRPLTVIFGRNNSGKTTLARLPIFAASSLIDYENLYVLSVGDIRFGSSFLDLASMDQAHPRIFFRMQWDPGYSLGIALQRVTAGMEQHSVQPRQVTIDDLPAVELELHESQTQPAFRLAQAALGEDERTKFDNHRRHLSRVVRGTIHVPSGRPPIQSTYATREPTSWTVGEVPYLLATDRRLMTEVADWFCKYIDGTRIDLDQAAFAFRFVEENGRSTISVAESGRGIQAVLPVVAILLGIARGQRRARLVVVEEPEEHLHPSAHGPVADLLIECSSKAQTVVETHSENLILRLRRRIADGTLSADDIALYFVTEDHAIIPVLLDEHGAAANWPSGVFESDVEEAQAIIEAKLSAMGDMG